jgi:hypothetical protein
MGWLEHVRQRHSAAEQAATFNSPAPLDAVHSTLGAVGNTTALAALLHGDDLDGWGALVTDATTLGLAGITPHAGPAQGSNQATLAVMRLARAEGVNHAALASLRLGGGRPLPPAILARVNAVFGADFSHVRLHQDAAAARMAEAAQARAFTVGHEIWFNAGELDLGTPEGVDLLLHELTHVMQHDEGRLPSGPGLSVSSPSDPHEQEAERVAASLAPAWESASWAEDPGLVGDGLFDDAAWASAVDAGPASADGVASRGLLDDAVNFAGDVADGAASMAGDAMEWAVRQASPELADLIAQGPKALIEGALMPALQGFLSGLTGGANLGGLMEGLKGSLGHAFEVIQGAAAGDAGCCEGFAAALDGLRSIGQSLLNNPAVEALRGGLGVVSGAIQDLFSLVAAPAFELMKGLLGGLWDTVAALAGKVAGWIGAVKDVAGEAVDWVMGKLGIDTTSEGGLLAWITSKASALWDTIRETLAPVIEPAQQVIAALSMLTGLGQLMWLVRTAPKVLAAAEWLWDHRDDPDLVANAHAELGDTWLPALLDGASALKEAFGGAASWLGGAASGLLNAVGALIESATGVPVLGAATSLLTGLRDGAQSLIEWGAGALSGASEAVSAVVGKVAAFVAPFKEVVCSIGLALTNPGMIPVILAGWAWQLLPECVKGPIIDLLLDAAIAALGAAPALPMFGLLWPMLKAGVLGFLAGMRDQAVAVKVAVADKVAKILSGASPEFLLGFAKGLLRGLWEGLTDPFKLAWTAVSGLGELLNWLGNLGAAPAEDGAAEASATPGASVGPRAREMATELRPPVEAAAAGFMPAVEEHFAGGEGLTLEGLMAQLGEVWGLVEGALHGAGGELAAGLCAWFTQPGAEGSIGEGVGWLAGTLVFEVLLALATAGTWTAVSGSIKTIARILDWTGEALGAAFKLLGKLGGELIQGVKSVARMVSDGAGGALKALLTSLEEIGAKLTAYADELLGRVGRSGVDEGVERGAKQGGEELGEEGVERGAKKGADDASPKPKADDAEKQRVALEARLVSQAMESAGRGVQEIVAALQASFMVRYPWIRDFTAEPRGLGWRIFLIASKKVVDDVSPRPDQRALPSSVRASSGVEVHLPAETLEHVLQAHTIANFDPIRRLPELSDFPDSHKTTLFPPGSITNAQELATLIRQALSGREGRSVRASGQSAITLTLRNMKVSAYMGSLPGGAGIKLNTIFPSSGPSITKAQIRSMKEEIEAGTSTLKEIRERIARGGP